MSETKKFRMTALRRFGDKIMQYPVLAGMVPNTFLITTRGRRTGRPRTHPVTLVERGGTRWLVAPYGPVAWVLNARAAGRVRLRRRGEDREWEVREIGPEEAGPILKDYLKITGPPRAYFHAKPDAPVEEFVAEAAEHPVFELVEVSGK